MSTCLTVPIPIAFRLPAGHAAVPVCPAGKLACHDLIFALLRLLFLAPRLAGGALLRLALFLALRNIPAFLAISAQHAAVGHFLSESLQQAFLRFAGSQQYGHVCVFT